MKVNKNKLNSELHKLTVNKYFPEIPLKLIGIVFKSFGINTDFLDGIYCGSSGVVSKNLSDCNLFWRMTWYKMPSGNYEIVCYVS